jgi:methylmalonyl-CoA mutase N-terminal domain/subunit
MTETTGDPVAAEAKTPTELVASRRKEWERGPLARSVSRVPLRKERFTTLSGLEIKDLYGPDDLADVDPMRDIGLPGEYPYTRVFL